MPKDSIRSIIRSQAPYLTWRFMGVWVLLALAAGAILYTAGLAPTGVAELGDFVLSPIRDKTPADPGTVIPGIPYVVVAAGPRTPKILAPEVGIDVPIIFPISTDIDVLNNDLTRGVVHYPGSALPGQNGTAFFFGHSTGLKVVHNKNFEAFNRLHELTPGATIRIQSQNREYWYRVAAITTKKAEEAWVDLRPSQERKLVLSTCRIFGAKDDRFVVEADFVKSYPLRSMDSAAGTSS